MSSSSDTEEMVIPNLRAPWDRPQLLAAPVRVDVGGLSHRGKVRPNNEDHFFVARFGRFLERLFTNLPDEFMPQRYEETGYGAVVADGIGGSASGEVASRLAISTFINLVLGTPDWILRLDDNLLQEEVKRRMAERFGQVGAAMAERAQTQPGLWGFGTTMTLAVSLGKDLFVTHIGDSRAYLLRRQRLHQLTRDHTLAQALVDRGVIGPQEAGKHRLRHVLTKSLGANNEPVEPDVQEVVLEDGDCLLLCTDGLFEMVKEGRIAEVLSTSAAAESACQRLVEDALEGGGKDNVTVVVARYGLPRDA
jgi:protein phosphatase